MKPNSGEQQVSRIPSLIVQVNKRGQGSTSNRPLQKVSCSCMDLGHVPMTYILEY